ARWTGVVTAAGEGRVASAVDHAAAAAAGRPPRRTTAAPDDRRAGRPQRRTTSAPDDQRGRIHELAGDVARTCTEPARAIGAVLGRPVGHRPGRRHADPGADRCRGGRGAAGIRAALYGDIAAGLL